VGNGASPALAVEDVSVEFPVRDGWSRVIHQVTLDLSKGEVLGIVGETGSGKSMTLRAIMNLIPPPGHMVSGRVCVEGSDLRRLSKRGWRHLRGATVGFVPQAPWSALDPMNTVERQFRDALATHRGLSRRTARAEAERMLQRLRIQDPARVLASYPHELSGGMAQRVVIGIVAVYEPLIVLADEPTTGLDVTVQREILDLLTSNLMSAGRALAIVSHDPGVVATYCDRVVVMFGGRVVETGPTDKIFTSPQHPYTKGLVTAMVGDIPESRPQNDEGVDGQANNAIGCPFAPRCRHAMDRCYVEEPVLRFVEPGRKTACHLY
jgi:oligopeptide/dipeptide ABC transporter ATP-binding protein